jgi:SAM-dependent methyltransferase
MLKSVIKWKNKATRLDQGLFLTLVQTIRHRLRMFLMPLAMVVLGKNFDFYGWKSLKIDETVFWNPEIESKQRDSQTEYLWDQVDMLKVKSVLEIGSLSGYRLFEAAKKYPQVNFFGVDISGDGVQASRNEATKRKLTNVEFFQFDVTSESFYNHFSEEKFDVVFSFATLICIHPTEIKKLLKFMSKASLMQLLLIEQSNVNLKMPPFYWGVPIPNNPNWIRNYPKILSKLQDVRNSKVITKQVSSVIWSPGGGHAQVISVTFS